MRTVCISVAFFIILIAPGCALFEVKPPMTQLQIREFQTRTFDTGDTKMVIKALLGVLQDEGFIVKSADVSLGFISAIKETDIGSPSDSFWAKQSNKGESARWKKLSVMETTANVSEFGSQCRVRVNFQEKIIDNMGSVIEVKRITDGSFYQDFFIKVDKGIFIQKEKL